MTSQPQENM